MAIKAVSIKIPDSMIEYAEVEDEKAVLIRNAMILYPYIQNLTISYGKAAKLLGIRKLDLISLFSELGLNYLDQSKEELEKDLASLKNFRNKKK